AADKNKFFLTGSLEGGSAESLRLPGFNSRVTGVTVGGVPLTEGVDYVVDEVTGQVQINEPFASQNPQIQYERADLFNFQTRRMLGARFDYNINKDIVLGATLLNLSERPVITRVNTGSEPVNNTMLGFDVSYKSPSRLLTRLVDKLPFIQTKQESNVTFYGEYAQLFPGAAPLSGQVSYIDDFEGLRTTNSLLRPNDWKLGATPQLFPNATSRNLDYGYNRALMSWYIIDRSFYVNGGQAIDGSYTLDNHYVRSVSPQEIFPNLSPLPNRPPLNVMDIAYYPNERGPYNYNPNLQNNGELPNPRNNFGAITRAITSDIDFDNANVEYVEFWMLDPFINRESGRVLDDGGINNPDNVPNTTGGLLYLNLGDISEDFIPDGRHAFENGLPEEGANPDNATENVWGFVSNQPYLPTGFNTDEAARVNQDVGMDGLRNDQEATFTSFQNFIARANSIVNDEIRQSILADISGDDFLGITEFPSEAEILERYKRFNGLEGNSPVASNQGIAVRSPNVNPDQEDLNRDNTINDLEGYYQYRIPLTPT
ncbi:MAG: cell surface protein SprA, partial [Bacteroidota bacterium]